MKVTEMQLEKGAQVWILTGCGGGYGDPALRDKSLIEEDIRCGFVSPEQAVAMYGYRDGSLARLASDQ